MCIEYSELFISPARKESTFVEKIWRKLNKPIVGVEKAHRRGQKERQY